MSPSSDRREHMIDVKPWMLPVIVVVLVVPAVIAWLLAGAFFGLLAGAVILIGIVIGAIRTPPQTRGAPPRRIVERERRGAP